MSEFSFHSYKKEQFLHYYGIEKPMQKSGHHEQLLDIESWTVNQ